MPASTFPSYKRDCDWTISDSLPVNDSTLEESVTCDSIIIGAGYTGLSIAQRLADLCPQDDIRVLDSENIGTGSPGRNSGFVLENAFTANNTAATRELYQQYRDVHREMTERAALLPLGVSSAKIFKGASTAGGVKSLDALVKHLSDSNQPFERMDTRQIQQITGSNYYRAGIMLPGSRLLNPYQLIRALANQVPDNISLHSNSPALTITREGSNWKVTTPKGSLLAPKLFLANNAFAKNLGYGKSKSVTIYTYAGVTAPLSSDELASITSKGQWGLLPAHRLGSTLRTTDDGRLLVRSMYGYEKEGGDEVGERLQQSLSNRFPNLQGAQKLENWWGGTTSLTANGAPLWGELESGLYASIGCNGVGILKGWMLGRELAQLSCNKPAMNVASLFGKPTWMPPEPIRQMGFLAVSTLEKRQAGNEI